MTGVYHLLIDAIQELRGKQAQVVFERLHLVFGLVGPVTVAQHLAQRVMMIRQFVDPIKVRIQSKPQYAKDQDAPLLHSRTPIAGIRFTFALYTVRNDFLQYGEDPLTQTRLGVDVLQSPQDLRNVVTRFHRQVDRADVHAIQQHLGIDHIAHRFWRTEVLGQ